MTDWGITHRVARKAHRCQMCSRTIDPGETYLRGAGFDGSAWSWKECAHCEAVRKMYDIQWDDEYNEDTYDTWSLESHTVTELRHAAGYRMRWRTRGGALLPVPAAEAVTA